MAQPEYPLYQNTIVPALHTIQERHGYLKPEEMKRFSEESGIPLHRLHEVASFFPHFRFSKPPKVTVKVCRDMACRMAGSARILSELGKLATEDLVVEGVSCQGRCDRPPAACVVVVPTEGHEIHVEHRPAAPAVPSVSVGTGMRSSNPQMRNVNPELTLSFPTIASPAPGQSLAQSAENAAQSTSQPATAAPEKHEHGAHELYYLGRSFSDLHQIIGHCLEGKPPPPDTDVELPYRAVDWLVDVYRGDRATYDAALKVAASRDASLVKAAEILQSQQGWSHDKAEQFRRAARRRLFVDEDLDETVLAAVLAWQTNDGWAAGNDLGNWSEAVLAEFDRAKSDLRGLGGAGMSATQKWRDVRDAIRNARRRKNDDRGFIVVNGDESEPATFKDRELLLRTPHAIVEGVILAGMVTEATQGFIYIRHEYEEQIEACRAEIKRAEALGVCGRLAPALGRPFPIAVFPSPGGYICGEQSALIEAMSDRRGEPRNMPPMLETNGLDDRPTLVSNVETYAWTPYIWFHGGQKYAELGTNTHKGQRFFSITGDLVRPGVYEVPMGMPLRDLIYGEKYCRGIKDGKKIKAFAPSGPSGGFLPIKLTAERTQNFLTYAQFPASYPAGILVLDGEKRQKHMSWKTLETLAARRGFDPMTKELDIRDFELELYVWRALAPTLSLGAGLVVYSEDRDMAVEAVNAIEFYRNESCGKCVPCRIGSQKLANLGGHLISGNVDAARWKETLLPLVKDLDEAVIQTSICGLGRSVTLPYRTVMNFFPEDVERHLKGR